MLERGEAEERRDRAGDGRMHGADAHLVKSNPQPLDDELRLKKRPQPKTRAMTCSRDILALRVRPTIINLLPLLGSSHRIWLFGSTLN
jgi:hypothetical protein